MNAVRPGLTRTDGGLDLRKNPDLSDAIGLIYGLAAVKRGKAP